MSPDVYVAAGRFDQWIFVVPRFDLVVVVTGRHGRARGIRVPDAVRERILAQKDPERLERWLEKAAVAASATAILDEPN